VIALVVLYIAVLSLILFISLPILATFLRIDPIQVWTQLQDPTILNALSVGLFSSAAATLFSFILGVPVGYFLATRRFRGKIFLDTFIDMPIVLPPAVAGIALLYAFAPRGLLGPVLNYFDVIIPGTTLAVIIAQVFVASPFILRSSKNAFQNIDPDIINSARILTPSKFRIFFTITLPLSKRPILSGLAMTWARAMGEFGATLMFAGNLPMITQTMPLAIYALMAADPFGATVLSALLIVISFSILILIKILEQKK
jgi:molybdate transport system permease protein